MPATNFYLCQNNKSLTFADDYANHTLTNGACCQSLILRIVVAEQGVANVFVFTDYAVHIYCS